MNQIIDFKQGSDTGDDVASSIQPIADGENLDVSTLTRSDENLRKRTELLRTAGEDAKYLDDSDRLFVISGGGNILWNGVADGRFTITANISLKPALAPSTCKPAFIRLGAAGSTNEVIIRTISATTAYKTYTIYPPRAYSGANKISFKMTSAVGASLSCTVSGTPADDVVVQIATTTNVDALITYLMANDAFRLLGLEAVKGAACVGTNLPTTQPTAALLQGAADAELHTITPGGLTSFFAIGTNRLQEGDTLAIYYPALVYASYGGRRQSINEAPESKDRADNNLFIIRLKSENAPGAIPICSVIGGDLIFMNGDRFAQAVTGAAIRPSYIAMPVGGIIQIGSLSSAAGVKLDTTSPTGQGRITIGKQGSADRTIIYDDFTTLLGGGNAYGLHKHQTTDLVYTPSGVWADSTSLSATTAETGLNAVVTTLGATTGAAKIGYAASTNWLDGTTNPAGSVKSQLDNIVTRLSSVGSAGSAKISSLVTGAWYDTTTVAAGSVKSQIDGIISALGSTGGAAKIGFAGSGAWKDGTTNPAAAVETQLDKIVSDLAGTAGGAKIGFVTGGTVKWADATGLAAASVSTAIDEIVNLLGTVGTDKVKGAAFGSVAQGSVKAQLTALEANYKTYADGKMTLLSAQTAPAGASLIGAKGQGTYLVAGTLEAQLLALDSAIGTKQGSLVAADATHDGYLRMADFNTFMAKQAALGPATGSSNGYLTSTDWTTFNNKQNTLGYASTSSDGKLSAADWNIFNGKQNALVAATRTQLGYLSAADYVKFDDKQNALSAATSSVSGYLTSSDWTTFNNKQAALSAANGTTNGYLSSADWTNFNSKAAGSHTHTLANVTDYTSVLSGKGGFAYTINLPWGSDYHIGTPDPWDRTITSGTITVYNTTTILFQCVGLVKVGGSGTTNFGVWIQTSTGTAGAHCTLQFPDDNAWHNATFTGSLVLGAGTYTVEVHATCDHNASFANYTGVTVWAS